jgi:hypothetical protein
VDPATPEHRVAAGASPFVTAVSGWRRGFACEDAADASPPTVSDQTQRPQFWGCGQRPGDRHQKLGFSPAGPHDRSVIIQDRPNAAPLVEQRVAAVAEEVQVVELVGFPVAVAVDLDRDRLARLARQEGQRAAGRQVVPAGNRGAWPSYQEGLTLLEAP